MGGEGEVVVGDLRDQADLGGAAVFLGGEEGLQGLLVKAADATEEVHLVGRHADVGAVFGDVEGAGDRETGRAGGGVAAGDAGVSVDRGEQVGPLDAVLGARLGDVADGDAQIAVFPERQIDDALQALVEDDIAPRQVGGGGLARGDRGRARASQAGPGLGDGQGGPLVGRGQGAGGKRGAGQQDRCEGAQGESGGKRHVRRPRWAWAWARRVPSAVPARCG